MFGPNGYSSQLSGDYLSIIDKHVAPALNLLITEYFNQFDESCQKMIADTLAVILKRQSDFYQDRGLSISYEGGGGITQKQIDTLINKCHHEINESPESITAFLSCELVGTILSKTNRGLQEYILKTFLQDKIIEPLISGDVNMSADSEEREDEINRKAAFI